MAAPIMRQTPRGLAPQSSTRPVRKPRNTLQILKSTRALLLISNVVLLIAALAGIEVHRRAIRIVGKDTAPSVIAAQHIKSAVADMDANAVNELLGSPASADGAGGYEERRVEAAAALLAAAENITFGDKERAPIGTLQIGIGTYERLIQRARDLRERSDPKFVDAYRAAAKLVDETLLPAADALDKANNDVLEQTYERQESESSGSMVFLAFGAMAALGGLVAVQAFLARRMRRTINPLLAAATLVAFIWTVWVFSAFNTEKASLKIAQEDAFVSIRALWRARATAYWANSDESRYLLDPAHASEYQSSFNARTESLAKAPAGMPLEEVAKAARSGVKVSGFSGYLGDEISNITFAGERAAAADTLSKYAEFMAIDRRVRQLETTGHHREAIELGAGKQAGQSDWAFSRFDDALGDTLKINQQAFDTAVSKGMGALDGLAWESAIFAAVVGVLMFLGFAPRIKEYE
jgi:hypothetical protein